LRSIAISAAYPVCTKTHDRPSSDCHRDRQSVFRLGPCSQRSIKPEKSPTRVRSMGNSSGHGVARCSVDRRKEFTVLRRKVDIHTSHAVQERKIKIDRLPQRWEKTCSITSSDVSTYLFRSYPGGDTAEGYATSLAGDTTRRAPSANSTALWHDSVSSST